MRIEEIMQDVSNRFQQANLYYGHGTDNPDDEAFALVCMALDLPFDEAILDRDLSEKEEQKITVLADKRIQTRKPLSYLTNTAYFVGLPFYVDERVLIPRSPFGELIANQFQPWIQPESVKSILDIGTGTGYLLRELSLRYPCALLFGLDISFQMLLKAKSAERRGQLIQADAEELALKKGRFDLVVSNLVYQWLSDLDKAFIQAWQVLDKRGKFYFTFFGRDTLSELKVCLAAAKTKSGLKNLPSKELVYRKLNASGFKVIEIVSLREEALFPDFFSLLKWLKLSGANRAGVRFRGLEAKGVLNKMDKIYAYNFRHNGKVFASFEKVIVKAEK